MVLSEVLMDLVLDLSLVDRVFLGIWQSQRLLLAKQIMMSVVEFRLITIILESIR